MMTPFKIITADCPWLFGDSLPETGAQFNETRGASKQYPCMTVAQLKAFPLPPLADDAVLFFWRVAAMQLEALQVIHAWGFNAPQSELVWLKKTKYGKRWFGMGRTVRMEHEVCLIAKRGKPQVQDHSTRSTFETDFDGLEAVVGRHSEKPDEFFQIVETLYDGPYVELFSRRQRSGWTCLGNEVA